MSSLPSSFLPSFLGSGPEIQYRDQAVLKPVVSGHSHLSFRVTNLCPNTELAVALIHV